MPGLQRPGVKKYLPVNSDLVLCLKKFHYKIHFPSRESERFIPDPDPALNFLSSGSSFEFSEFRIWIHAKVPDPCGSGSNTYYLSTYMYLEIGLKKNISTICHFLFNTSVLQFHREINNFIICSCIFS